MNEIEIYQNNSKTIICTVQGIDSLSGYTAVMTVKENIDDIEPIFSISGDTIGLTTTFELLPTMTNIDSGLYHYDVVYSNGVNNYTAIQSQLTILDSVKY